MIAAPAIFLDRDGVINRAFVRDGKPYPPPDLASFELLPGVVEAAHLLKDAGFLLFVVTNQPDVSTGKLSRAVLDRIHDHLNSNLPVDRVYACLHIDQDDCTCRKPRTGMLDHAFEEFLIDREDSFMIGDRWRDVSAGKAAGCRTILIGDGYQEHFPDAPDWKFPSLRDAALWILGRRIERSGQNVEDAA